MATLPAAAPIATRFRSPSRLSVVSVPHLYHLGFQLEKLIFVIFHKSSKQNLVALYIDEPLTASLRISNFFFWLGFQLLSVLRNDLHLFFCLFNGYFIVVVVVVICILVHCAMMQISQRRWGSFRDSELDIWKSYSIIFPQKCERRFGVILQNFF